MIIQGGNIAVFVFVIGITADQTGAGINVRHIGQADNGLVKFGRDITDFRRGTVSINVC